MKLFKRTERRVPQVLMVSAVSLRPVLPHLWVSVCHSGYAHTCGCAAASNAAGLRTDPLKSVIAAQSRCRLHAVSVSVLQNGDSEVGVSVLFTEQKMDAGPIIAQEALTIDQHIQAPELLSQLFSIGTR